MASPGSGREASTSPALPEVSRREHEVLAALGERLTNAEIAERLFISVRTVETHVSSLLRKFSATSRRELTEVARRNFAPDGPVTPPLPVTLTALIGRERDVVSVLTQLNDASLVTLTGPAGVGKTRLAIEVATRLRESTSAVFVDLAVCTDEATIVGGWLTALEGPVASVSGRSGLLQHLADHPPVVAVLDNCEHVVDTVVPLVLDALAASPSLKVLATSREALAVPGERVLTVEPLDGDSAARLFIERASGIDRSLADPQGTAQVIDSICVRLDRLPLAIELAAAQVGVLSPEQIDVRLSDRFALLRAPARGRTPRHAGLETALAWSYDLLDARERVLLDRLSVFRGWFDLDAVEAVAVGPPVERRSLLDLMTRLVRKSLVVSDRVGDERRYRLLETVREYGWSRLGEADELDRWRHEHLEWVLDLLERAEDGLRSDAQAHWFTALDHHLANIEFGLDWSVHAPDQAERALRAVQGTQHYWLVGGVRRSAGLRWLRATTEAASALDSRTRTRGLVDAVLLLTLDDIEAAAGLLPEVRAVTDDDPLARGYAALASAIVAVHRGAGDAEVDATHAAAAIPESDPRHWWAKGMAAFALGQRGLYAEAVTALRDTAEGFRQLGDEHVADGALSYIADLLVAAGDADAAKRTAELALASAIRFDCASCESLAAGSMALVEPAAADRLAGARRALLLADRIGETWSVLAALDLVAAGLADVGQPRGAVLVASAAKRHRKATGFAPVLPTRARQADHALATARRALDEEDLSALQAQAVTLTLAATIELALDDAG